MESVANFFQWLIKTVGIASLSVIAFFVIGIISLLIHGGWDDEDDDDDEPDS